MPPTPPTDLTPARCGSTAVHPPHPIDGSPGVPDCEGQPRRATEREIAQARAWVEHYAVEWHDSDLSEAARAQEYEHALEVLIHANGGHWAEPVGTLPEHLRGDGPCQGCGTLDNICWTIDSAVWNLVLGGPEARDDPGGILCIPCFVKLAHVAGFGPLWHLGHGRHVGRCGDTPKPLFDGAAPVTCALPAGHAGWHRSDGGTEWGIPAETDRLVVAVLDAAIVWRQDVGEVGPDEPFDPKDRALVAAVDAMLAARHNLRDTEDVPELDARTSAILRSLDDGLHAKFVVRRRDGRDRVGGDKADARYFVLDYVHDPYARTALAAYATACEPDLPRLAQDLRDQLASLGVAAGEPVTPAADLADEAAHERVARAISAVLWDEEDAADPVIRKDAYLAAKAAIDAYRAGQRCPSDHADLVDAYDRLARQSGRFAEQLGQLSQGLRKRGITFTANGFVADALAHIDRLTTALNEAARDQLAECELVTDDGLSAEQEIRARALDIATRVLNDRAEYELGEARHLASLAARLVPYIRDGRPDDPWGEDTPTLDREATGVPVLADDRVAVLEHLRRRGAHVREPGESVAYNGTDEPHHTNGGTA